jgi:stress response protein YsnF
MARHTDDLSSPSEQERRLATASSDEEALREAGSILSEEEKQRLAEPDRVISGRPGFIDHAASTHRTEAQDVAAAAGFREEGGLVERVEERAVIGKVLRDAGGVRVSTRTETVTDLVRDTLTESAVEVERVAVGRFVDAEEEPRVEGDVTVVPVYEERLVVERRLFLVEEVHLRRVARERAVEVPVELRKQVVDVERLPPEDDPNRSAT